MKSFKIIIIIAGLVFKSSIANADFGKCDTMFPNSRPPKLSKEHTKNTRELCFNDFAVLYSIDKKIPIYTIEKLNYLRLNGKEKRTNHFHEEPKLKVSERSTLDDYVRSGYDRGHMAPAADFNNPISMEESFSLSNMAPQSPKLNRGIWAKNVERPTRQFAKRAQGNVYVFTGPFFLNKKLKTIGKNKVAVPDYFFKLVFDEANKKTWVYWVENSNNATMKAPISYNEFVSISGLNLLNY